MKSESLPKAWSDGCSVERAAELRKLPHRVRVLLATECARSVLPVFEATYPTDRFFRNAILAAEAWVAEPSKVTADAARTASIATYGAAAAAAYAAVYAAAYAVAAAYAAAAAYGDVNAGKNHWHWIYATYCQAIGPDTEFHQSWRNETTVALARGIMVERAFDRMPILADALEDAGCDSPDLWRLRAESGEFTAADWWLWQLTSLSFIGDDQ